MMKKNYYDILQVNKNASAEIIEKAYKVLAKKYHPDLQTEENKKESEEVLKEINEAYEILSNPEKKQEYDELLRKEEFATFSSSEPNNKENYTNHVANSPNANNSYTEEEILRQQVQALEQEKQYKQQEQLKKQQELAYQEQLQQARQKAYHDAYIQDLRNRGYKIRYKKTLKDYIRGFITLLAVILVLFLLYQIPFVKRFFIHLYEENEIVHYLVEVFTNLFKK